LSNFSRVISIDSRRFATICSMASRFSAAITALR
jgi:hypothetical protein